MTGDSAGGGTGLPPLELPGWHTGLLDRLAEVAEAQPDHVAVESGDGRMTYAQLVERVTAVAASVRGALAEAGAQTVDPEWPDVHPVGILAAPTCDALAAALGVLAAGQPLVLLDLLLPDARAALIAERAGAVVMLADDERQARALAIPGVRVVRGLHPLDGPALDGTALDGPALDGPAPAAAPARPTSLDDAASILFTSGTTGAPKGVVVSHGKFLASAYAYRRKLGLGPADRVGMTLPWAFAAGQELSLGALMNGATLCVRDLRVHGMRDVADWVESERISTLHCTPSLLRALVGALRPGQVLSGVRTVTTAGEKVYPRDIAGVREHLPETACVVNYLGSSETGAFAFYEMPGTEPLPEGNVPAGWGLPTREYSVVGPDGEPLPTGEVGQLCITSRYLSLGYWQDPAGTRARFSTLADGRRRFVSGDRATVAPDGMLTLLGRADDAVKIRGYLVEPAEVEAALRQLPDVSQAVVRAREDGDTSRLVAWVVPDQFHRTPSPPSVRAELARLLPDYMVPRDVVLVTEIPRDVSGKADLGALPDPPPRPAPVPPETAWEGRIETLWASMLRLEHVGRDESFTALGADSLAVEEMLARVSDSFAVSMATADLAEHPTLAQFAARVAEVAGGHAENTRGSHVRLRAGEARPPVYCFAGAGAQAAYFGPFAEFLGPDQQVDGFQVNGFENLGIPDWTVRRTARRYVRTIEKLTAPGPVVLVGHSLGGLIALEAAHLLTAQGWSVPLVALLDTYLPPRARPGAGVSAPAFTTTPASTPGSAASAGLWRTRFRVVTAGLRTYDDLQVRKEVFQEHGERIVKFHRPRPWAGRSMLFVSNENSDDASWWTPILTGSHELHRLDCDHVALLRRPYVEEVAARVAAVIEELREHPPAP